MNLFSELAGNEHIKKTLANDIFNKKHSHAYIIEGAKGSGKHTVAYLAAAALVCENDGEEKFPCGKCSACRKTFEKINADITVISKESRATLGVDAVRQIKETLKLAPVEMPYKVYIIEDADKMTKQAQNALLLSLEEPPAYVMFILLCEDTLALLDTVKSRAPILRCEVFDKNFIKEFLLENPVYSKFEKENPNRFDEVCVAANGSIGAAIELLNVKKAGAVHEYREAVQNAIFALCTGTKADKIDSLSSFPTSRAELSDFLCTMQVALRDILYYKKKKSNAFMFFSSEEDCARQAGKISIRRLCEIDEALTQAIFDVGANLSVNAVLTLFVTK